MPKKKTPAEKPKDQFKRFIEAAKELGVDANGKSAAEAFDRLAKRRTTKDPKATTTDS